MLSKELSNKVLTIGCEYDPPKGGVAQVMYTYSKEVYPVFHCITNSGEGGTIRKLWQLVRGWLKTASALLFNRNVEIVHIHTASYNSFKRSTYFVSLAKWFKKKVVLHIHGGGFKDYYKTNPEWIKKELLRADYVIALTDTWTQYYRDNLKLPYVATVKNIVSNPQIGAVEKDDRLHLLFLGAINDQKGIFDLLEVINEHQKEWASHLLLHVGGNQEIERLERYIKDNNLEDLVQYEGWVSGDKKRYLLNLSDAYILPSYIEGLPISILETLSYGKPVITTPVGGIPEVVNEKNGYLFTPGDRQAMYEIINGIIDNPEEMRAKAKNAQTSVGDNFPNRIAEVLERVYNQLLVK